MPKKASNNEIGYIFQQNIKKFIHSKNNVHLPARFYDINEKLFSDNIKTK